MRDEEAVTLLQQKVEQEIEKMVSEGEKVEEGDDYLVMRVSKKTIDDYGKGEAEQVWAYNRH